MVSLLTADEYDTEERQISPLLVSGTFPKTTDLNVFMCQKCAEEKFQRNFFIFHFSGDIKRKFLGPLELKQTCEVYSAGAVMLSGIIKFLFSVSFPVSHYTLYTDDA